MFVAGLAATSTVVGAEVGLPAMAAGGTISLFGAGLETAVDFITEDWSSGVEESLFIAADILAERAVDKLVPGPTPDIIEKGIVEMGRRVAVGIDEAGHYIYKATVNLKVTIAERATDEIQEANKVQE
jgi:hypothetical protein